MSPELTVFEADRAPLNRQLDRLSQIATWDTVQEGMFVNDGEFDIEETPPEAAPKVIVWRAYEPPVTSLEDPSSPGSAVCSESCNDVGCVHAVLTSA